MIPVRFSARLVGLPVLQGLTCNFICEIEASRPSERLLRAMTVLSGAQYGTVQRTVLHTVALLASRLYVLGTKPFLADGTLALSSDFSRMTTNLDFPTVQYI
jgi:hypothetical protein